VKFTLPEGFELGDFLESLMDDFFYANQNSEPYAEVLEQIRFEVLDIKQDYAD
jgi:hypothetical protein